MRVACTCCSSMCAGVNCSHTWETPADLIPQQVSYGKFEIWQCMRLVIVQSSVNSLMWSMRANYSTILHCQSVLRDNDNYPRWELSNVRWTPRSLVRKIDRGACCNSLPIKILPNEKIVEEKMGGGRLLWRRVFLSHCYPHLYYYGTTIAHTLPPTNPTDNN